MYGIEMIRRKTQLDAFTCHCLHDLWRVLVERNFNYLYAHPVDCNRKMTMITFIAIMDNPFFSRREYQVNFPKLI